jgi:hypothetical protein
VTASSSATSLTRRQLAILAEVFRLAGALDAKSGPDVALVLRVLASARPNVPQIAAAEARLRLQARDFIGARNLLEDAERASPASALIKAMLAFTLFMQGDGLWHAYAAEVRALPVDESAKAIVVAIERAGRSEPDPEIDAPDAGAGEPGPTAWMPAIGLAC